ncbi:NAD-aldehyde dehydrogenase [Gautieria morchelliformis]|nr:NAD-aldehyde dehydrogenase [Gautieria morchelliformis]
MASLVYTPVHDIPQIREHLRASFRRGRTDSVAYRKEQLLQLAYLFQDNVPRFQKALLADLGRPKIETNLFDLSIIISECMYAYKNIESWTKPEKVPFNINWFAFSPKVYKEPKGTVLIITPFNFPLYCLAPLTGAIAAGCAAVVKPSELTPATSALLTELFPKYLDNDLYRVVNGAVEETTKLLELQWDHILYTGGGRVGRVVATAAAIHLTPVTLELGGKCPAVVDSNADFDMAAKRILWGKMTNAGQTCVAPDYVLVPHHVQSKLVEAFKEHWFTFYGSDSHTSDSFSRICSENHWDRISGMLKNTQGDVILGGEMSKEDKFIAPTVVTNVSFTDSLMKEEIFGPVLPIISVPDVDSALDYINSHDHPLALYAFSNDAKVCDYVRKRTLSGSFLANDLLLQANVSAVPFGGVGGSGYGSHKGKFSFDMFTHQRPVLRSPKWIDLLMSIRYPPYTDKSLKRANQAAMPKIPYPRPGESDSVNWMRWSVAAFTVVLVVANRHRVLDVIRASRQ